MLKVRKCRIGIVGHGHVGVQLAAEYGKHFETPGFHVKAARIEEFKTGQGSTRKDGGKEFAAATRLSLTSDLADINPCQVYIGTVAPQIDTCKRSDLGLLVAASAAIGKVLKKANIVVYDFPVYRGFKSQVCVPILERESGLTFNKHFFVDYSRKHINPDYNVRGQPTIKKATSPARRRRKRISRILCIAPSLWWARTRPSASRWPKAAKVIENSQRDVNVALINELALILTRCGIDTEEVLQGAWTKCNFLRFRARLVWGDCIGVDPYYRTQKAREIGYHPELSLFCLGFAGNMVIYVAFEIVKLMTRKQIQVKGARILMLGVLFRGQCADIHNSGLIEAVREIRKSCARIDISDRWSDLEGAGTSMDGVSPVLWRKMTMTLCPWLWCTRGSASPAVPACASSVERGAGAKTSNTYSKPGKWMVEISIRLMKSNVAPEESTVNS